MQFIVTNGPELDFNLLQEVWEDDRLLANLRNLNGEWMVTFFSDDQPSKSPGRGWRKSTKRSASSSGNKNHTLGHCRGEAFEAINQ